jgi:hypothetical protein
MAFDAAGKRHSRSAVTWTSTCAVRRHDLHGDQQHKLHEPVNVDSAPLAVLGRAAKQQCY